MLPVSQDCSFQIGHVVVSNIYSLIFLNVGIILLNNSPHKSHSQFVLNKTKISIQFLQTPRYS